MECERCARNKIYTETKVKNENRNFQKNIYYFHNACTQYKFNFVSSEDKTTSFSNWYENLDKTSKLRKNRSSNLVVFGLAESKSILTSEIEKFDVELFAKLIGELEY